MDYVLRYLMDAPLLRIAVGNLPTVNTGDLDSKSLPAHDEIRFETSVPHIRRI